MVGVALKSSVSFIGHLLRTAWSPLPHAQEGSLAPRGSCGSFLSRVDFFLPLILPEGGHMVESSDSGQGPEACWPGGHCSGPDAPCGWPVR